MAEIKTKLLTRKTISDIWARDTKYHDFVCCPNCRDILQETTDKTYLFCSNAMCTNKTFYKKEEIEKV